MPDPGQGAEQAIDLAARVGEVGFAEFTSDLVTNVFNALVDANQQQTAQYIQLVQTLSGSLADYVTRTSDAIGAEQIDDFLEALGVRLDNELKAGDRDIINGAVELKPPVGVDGGDNRVATTNPNASEIQKIRAAIARRIAANRYEFLQGMVQLGVLRVVVDHGVVETRLSFRTRGLTARGEREASKTRGTLNKGYAGWGISTGLTGVTSSLATGLEGIGAAFQVGPGGNFGASTDVVVRTTSSYDRDVTGSSVQIFGRVRLHYKSDYQPLNR